MISVANKLVPRIEQLQEVVDLHVRPRHLIDDHQSLEVSTIPDLVRRKIVVVRP